MDQDLHLVVLQVQRVDSQVLGLAQGVQVYGRVAGLQRRGHLVRGAATPVHPEPDDGVGDQVVVVVELDGDLQARDLGQGIHDDLAGGPPVISRAITAYLPEGTVAAPLGELQARYPDVDMGSYPFYRAPRYGTSLVLRGTDEVRLAAAARDLEAMIIDLGGEPETDPAD